MLKKGFVWIFVLAFFHLNALAQEIVFSAQATAQKVGIKDRFQVVYTLTNMEDWSNFKPPVFNGFNVLGPPSQSSGTNITFNGNGQSRQINTIRIIYDVAPKAVGNFTILPARVTYNGREMASNTVQVQVVEGSLAQQQRRQQSYDPFGDDDSDPFAQMNRMQQQMMQQFMQMQQSRQQQSMQQQSQAEEMIAKDVNKYVFIRVQVDKTNPYVGEQITASYKLYSRLPMQASLTALPSLNGFWSQDFEIPRPTQPVLETLNGQQYQVFLLKKSALFPQQSGVLTLDPAKAEGVITYYNNIPIKISSAPVKITVKPLPMDKQPASFTGAVGNFTVDAHLDKKSLSTDDAASFVFTIKGSGNLKLIGNPKIVFPQELGVYEPQITDTITSRNPSITGSKIFSYNMNPQTPGDYEIPAISFSYYDVASGSYKETITQPIKVHVTKGKNYNPNAVKVATLTDIHDINKAEFASGNTAQPIANKMWYWALYLMGAGGLVTLLLFKKQQEMYEGNQALFKNKKANKIAWKRLGEARKLLPQQQHKAFYEEVSKAIWLYLSDKLNIPISRLSKETMEDELEAKQVPAAQINRVKGLVLECEMALYSPSGGQQQRQHTLDEAVGTIGELETVLKNKKNAVQYAS